MNKLDIYEKTELIRGSTARPITLEEVKDHLRMERGETAEDDFLKALIHTAETQVEDYTGRTLMRKKRAVYFNEWSTDDCFMLPHPPLISVSSSTAIADGSSGAAVCYKNSTRGWSSFSSTGWITDTISEPGRVCLEYGQSWPSAVLHNINPIKVHYVCGYSTSSTGIPQHIRTAMKLMIGHLYENREEVVVGYGGVSAIKIPKTVETLLASYRVWGL